MSVIRRSNWENEDLMFDIIHDLIERAEALGLPNIGMYESRKELHFGGEPVTTIGILPASVQAIAAYTTKNKVNHILIRFYHVSKKVNPTNPTELVTPEETMRYEFAPPSEEGMGLTRAALAIALLFFGDRNWFTPEKDSENSTARSEQKVRLWANAYFKGYEDRAVEIYKHYLSPKEAK
jgi:hypothetical protein